MSKLSYLGKRSEPRENARARLVPLAQIGELARRLLFILNNYSYSGSIGKWKLPTINNSILFFCVRNNNDRKNNKICTPYSKMESILLSYNRLIGPQCHVSRYRGNSLFYFCRMGGMQLRRQVRINVNHL